MVNEPNSAAASSVVCMVMQAVVVVVLVDPAVNNIALVAELVNAGVPVVQPIRLGSAIGLPSSSVTLP